jgi:phage protein U
MFAQLGSTIFENIQVFNEFSKTGSAVYAEHALLDGKPRLQRVGSALDEINISMRLHASFCNPAQQLNILREASNEGEILPFLWGNGTVEGSFVITDISETIEDADNQGNVFSYVLGIILREYVAPDPIRQEQEQQRKEAKAVGNKKPVAKKKVNPETCPQAITKIVTRIENHGGVVNKIMLEGGGVIVVANKPTLTSNLTAIDKLAEDLIRRCDDPNSCAYGNIQLRNWATTVSARADGFKFDIANNSTDLDNDNTNLQAAIRSLKGAASSLVNQTITRK